MADTGWVSPGTVANGAFVDMDWTSPGNAAASDNAYASAAGDYITTSMLYASNFGLSGLIPAGATIDGVTVAVERKCTNGLASTSYIALTLDGINGSTGNYTGGVWPLTDTYAEWGGAADTWGEAYTRANLIDSAFGVLFQAWAGLSYDEMYVDHLRIKVTYTEAASTYSGQVIIMHDL